MEGLEQMIFDIDRVYTQINANKLKIGDKVILADTLADLEKKVEVGTQISVLKQILSKRAMFRFCNENYTNCSLAYLVERGVRK